MKLKDIATIHDLALKIGHSVDASVEVKLWAGMIAKLTPVPNNTPNVPNLDAMEADELQAFWRKHGRGHGYKDLFPGGGRGSQRATRGLANYAINKFCAIEARKQGNINTALDYERICDSIYKALPERARW